MAFYGTPAEVRRLYSGLTSTVISDQELEAIGADTDTELDAELAGYGAPWTGTAPAIIRRISSMLCCAQAFDDRFWQTAQESGVARMLRERAQQLIQKIKAGEITDTGISQATVLGVTDPEADRAHTEVFTGSEVDWAARAETRAV